MITARSVFVLLLHDWEAHSIFVLHCDVSDKHMLCFAFDSYVSDKRTLYFYFIATLVMKQAVLDCYVSEKSKLYLYFVATLVMKYAVFVFDC